MDTTWGELNAGELDTGRKVGGLRESGWENFIMFEKT